MWFTLNLGAMIHAHELGFVIATKNMLRVGFTDVLANGIFPGS